MSEALVRLLAVPPLADSAREPQPSTDLVDPPAAATHEDRLLTLWVLQELHYRGFQDVAEEWEWDPTVTTLRVSLERDLESRLRERWTTSGEAKLAEATGDTAADLFALVERHEGLSVARHLHHHGTPEQAHDLLRQRSIYHLKEADPTAWVVPRLDARAKAALVEIQYDEYGAGDPSRLHHHLFEKGLAACGLESDYGAYIDEAMPETLEQNVSVSMFGLHRRLRGAALGHFAAFEATSSLPARQLAQGLRRLGLPDLMSAYYDEHVEADAVHEQLAAREVCGVLVEQEPELLEDVMFGAWTCLDLESRSAAALLDRWSVAA